MRLRKSTVVGVFKGVEQSLDALEELAPALEFSIFRITFEVNLLISLMGVKLTDL